MEPISQTLDLLQGDKYMCMGNLFYYCYYFITKCMDPFKRKEAKDLLLNEIAFNWQSQTNIQPMN